jgi:hypothetical protein
MLVDKSRFWEKLVDHYYDNVHWKESNIQPTTTFLSWLVSEYDAYLVSFDTIKFMTPEKYSWFILRWS